MPATRVMIERGLPLVVDLQVRCPAGAPVGQGPAGTGCICRVEDNVISAATDPTSLILFCTADSHSDNANVQGYQSCPTWRAEKQRIWAEQGAFT